METPYRKLDDPEWRRARAQKAALARTTAENAIAVLERRSSELTDVQRERLAALLGSPC